MRNQAPLASSLVTETVAPVGVPDVASRDLVSAFKDLWMRGNPVDVNAFLAEHPELAGRKSAVLDLAYEEYCQRREKGLAVDADAFCAAIPRFKTSLRRLLEADRCLAEHSGGEAAPPMRWPEAGDDFLGFMLRRELGRGAFARVFLAAQPALGERQVVVKISWHGADEAQTLGRSAHPNVVPVYSVQKEELSGLTAICMPYLGRATLCDVLDEAFARPPAERRASTILEAARPESEPPAHSPPSPALLRYGTYVDGLRHITAQLAAALDFLHRSGVCHRDLKPSNVLIAPDGRPMLLDFNLSFDARRAQQRFGGTLPYMAPEHLRAVELAGAHAETANPRADLFALGVLAYELFTGEHPFGPISLNGSALELRARLLERQRRGPPPLQKRTVDLPAAVARVIERCLAYEPADRPESAAEVAAVLRPGGAWLRLGRRWVGYHRLLLGQVALGMAIALAMAAGLGNLYSWLGAEAARSAQPGWDAYRGGRFDEAVRALGRIVDSDPTFAPAYYGRGRAYLRLGQIELAEADFQEADRLAGDGRSRACLGYCRNLLGRHGAAAFHYEKALEAGFVSAEVYNNLGYSYLESYGRLDRARASLTQAIRLNERLQAAYYNRALAELRDAEQNPYYVPLTGFQDVRKALHWGPDSAELLFDAARLAAIQEGRREIIERDKPAPLPLMHPLRYLEMARARGLNAERLENPDFRPWHQDPRFLKLAQGSVGGELSPKAIRVLDPVHD